MRGLARKRGFIQPVIAGGLSAVAYIYSIPLLLALGYGLFILSLYRQPLKLADISGLLFGISFFSIGLYWFFSIDNHYLANTQLVFNGFAVLAVILMSLLFAFFAILVTIFPEVERSSFAWFSLIVPSSLAFIEWVKIYYLTGFPWFQASHIFTGSLFKGWYAIFGEIGVSFFFYFFVSLSCFVIVSQNKKKELIKLLSLLIIFGGLTKVVDCCHFGKPLEQLSSLGAILINSNSNREEKELYFERLSRMRRYQQMVLASTDKLDVSLWPESASGVGVYSEIKNELSDDFSKIRSKGVEVLFGGYLRKGMFEKNVIISTLFNKAVYTKQHLVPVGEYIPSWFTLFDVWIPGVFQGSTVTDLDYKSDTFLNVKGVGYTPIICYEVLFNNEIRSKSRKSGMLFVFSDLSAVKYSWVKEYFFNVARIRAMELKKPLLVSSNHGVTGFVSGNGSVLKRAVGKEAFVYEEITPGREDTPFLLYGNTMILLILLLLFILGGGLITFYPASGAKYAFIVFSNREMSLK